MAVVAEEKPRVGMTTEVVSSAGDNVVSSSSDDLLLQSADDDDAHSADDDRHDQSTGIYILHVKP